MSSAGRMSHPVPTRGERHKDLRAKQEQEDPT